VTSPLLSPKRSKVIARNRTKITETVSVGPTELGLRGNQEFLTLILNPNTAVFLGCM
jgi:hypothetical protein